MKGSTTRTKAAGYAQASEGRQEQTMDTMRVANSTPIVLFSSIVKVSRVKRDNRLDLPTPGQRRIEQHSRQMKLVNNTVPESPTNTILKRWSKLVAAAAAAMSVTMNVPCEGRLFKQQLRHKVRHEVVL
jgi:hypothetical protein